MRQCELSPGSFFRVDRMTLPPCVSPDPNANGCNFPPSRPQVSRQWPGHPYPRPSTLFANPSSFNINEPRRKTTRLRKPQKLLLTSWCPRRNVTVIRFIAKQTVLGNNSLLLFVYTILNPLYYKRRRGCKGEPWLADEIRQKIRQTPFDSRNKTKRLLIGSAYTARRGRNINTRRETQKVEYVIVMAMTLYFT